MAHTSHKEKDFTETAKDFGNQARKEVKGAGQQFGQAAGQATEEAQGMLSTAAQKTKDAASYVGDKAEQATHAVGEGMESLGGSVRRMTPKEGMLHTASESVAGTLESSGRYLEEHGLKGIGDDVTALIRKNPIPALLVGIGVGFMLARLTRS
jgi:hypothetical protein